MSDARPATIDGAALNGAVLIGAAAERRDGGFRAVDPASGEEFEPRFAEAGDAEVERATRLAEAAFDSYAETDPDTRARFLESIADRIDALGDTLTERAMRETGLPRARLESERGRTVGQLRFFAQIVRAGEWIEAALDPAQPERAPLPRPDLRRRHVALGPVAVFGASNFPLAFSVAGGDTASALAAGCPVVVKGHPAHPGTGELVGRAIQAAVADCGLHEGVFSLLPGTSNALGAALVADPRIQAVGFTGSRAGGLALVTIAAQRAEPIPVHAEMSSVNPVFLFPAALEKRARDIAAALVQSLTLGAGQFCTNPGLVIAIEAPALDDFAAAAAAALGDAPPAPMLTPAIHDGYARGVAAFERHGSVITLARGPEGKGANRGRSALFQVDAQRFLADAALTQEVFGASSLLVRCRDADEMAQVARSFEGQLTATLQVEPADEPAAAKLLPVLERKAGRILANGWPTGVEVAHAMVHGGPFPATSDARTTSVGALAIRRFLRPVCYQNLPASLLPPALADDNPWKLPRRIDGAPEP